MAPVTKDGEEEEDEEEDEVDESNNVIPSISDSNQPEPTVPHQDTTPSDTAAEPMETSKSPEPDQLGWSEAGAVEKITAKAVVNESKKKGMMAPTILPQLQAMIDAKRRGQCGSSSIENGSFYVYDYL